MRSKGTNSLLQTRDVLIRDSSLEGLKQSKKCMNNPFINAQFILNKTKRNIYFKLNNIFLIIRGMF